MGIHKIIITKSVNKFNAVRFNILLRNMPWHDLLLSVKNQNSSVLCSAYFKSAGQIQIVRLKPMGTFQRRIKINDAILFVTNFNLSQSLPMLYRMTSS